MTETKQEMEAMNYIISNKVIIDFLRTEAIEQTAFDMRAKTGSGITAKGIEMILMRNKRNTMKQKVLKRVNTYLAIGIKEAVTLRLESL